MIKVKSNRLQYSAFDNSLFVNDPLQVPHIQVKSTLKNCLWTVSTDVKVWAVSLTAVTLSLTSMTFLTQEMPSLSPRNLNFLHLTQSSPSYLNNDQVHFPLLEMTGQTFHLSWFVDLSLGQHSSQIIDNFGLSCRAGKLE